MKFGLNENTIQNICNVFARYPQMEKVILYGSRAKGNYKNGSDIDLTLCGGKDLTFDILQKLTIEIDDLLIPYTVDLSIFHEIKDTEMIDHIQRVGKEFYQKV